MSLTRRISDVATALTVAVLIAVAPTLAAHADSSVVVSGTVNMGDDGGTRAARAGEVSLHIQQLVSGSWSSDGAGFTVDSAGRWSATVSTQWPVRIHIVYSGSGAYATDTYSASMDQYALTSTTTVPSRFSMAGTVHLSTGGTAPAGSVRIDLEALGSAAGSAVVGNGGTWTIPQLPGSTYFVTATWVASTGAWFTAHWTQTGCAASCGVPVHANVAGIDLTLQRAGSISGTVRADDVIRSSVQVELDSVNTSTGDLTDVAETVSDANGAYRFSPLSSGSYAIFFHSSTGGFGDQSWSGRDIYDDPDVITLGAEDRTGIDADLVRSASLTGTVSGVPAADLADGDVTIEIQLPDDNGDYQTVDEQDVSADGTYTIDGLPPEGDYYQFVVDYDGPLGHSALSGHLVRLEEGMVARFDPIMVLPAVPRDQANFISLLYNDFLDREPSTSEVANWGDALKRGFPRGSISGGFVNSDEYRLIRIDAAYETILGRPSEPSGRAGWLAGMKAGTLQTDYVDRSFYKSEEFFENKGGNTDLGYVEALYADILHRPATNSEAQGWAARLTLPSGAANRLTRSQLVDIFWISQETGQERAAVMFQTYLRRPPLWSEEVTYGGYVLRYGDSAVRSMITGSDEYFKYAQTTWMDDDH